MSTTRLRNRAALEPAIWEQDELLSNCERRSPFVLSMSADDSDWTAYRRRSSGGSASTLLIQGLAPDDWVVERMNEMTRMFDPPDQTATLQDSNIGILEQNCLYDIYKLRSLNVTNQELASWGKVNGSVDSQNKLSEQAKNLRSHQRVSPPFDETSIHDYMNKRHHGVWNQPSFDISGQTDEHRFPWLRDIAVQCQLEAELAHQTGLERINAVNVSSRSPDYKKSGVHSERPYRVYAELQDDDMEAVPMNTIESAAQDVYSDPSFSTNEELDQQLARYKTRRRPCIISNLDLGPEAETEHGDEDSSPEDVYPGDLVVHNGHGFHSRSSLPPAEVGVVDTNSQTTKSQLYGSESSLTETSASPITEKSKVRPTRSFLKLLKQKKSSPETLEQFLCNDLKPSEFKDERLVSYINMRWTEAIVSKDVELMDISETEHNRRDAVWELFTSECVFLKDHLMTLKHCFMDPLKKCQVEGLLMDVEPYKLFGNLDELCHLSYAFCRDFMNSLKLMTNVTFGSTQTLVDCLDRMTSKSRDGETYHAYLLNYKSALTTLESLRNTVEEMAVFEKYCEQDQRCNRLKLTDLLIAPMHHWTRLPLILSRIRKYTTDEDEARRLEESIQKVVTSLKSLENKMELQKSFERVREIQQQLVWPTLPELDSKAFIPESVRGLLNTPICTDYLGSQARDVLYEGQLMLTEKSGTTDVYLFLFTDFLLFTRIKKDSKRQKGRISVVERSEGFYYVHKQPISVSGFTIHDISTQEASSLNIKNAFVLIQRNSFQQITGVLTIQAHTSLGKQKWLKVLHEAQEKYSLQAVSNDVERRESFKKMLSQDETTSLLKNSQVLEITSATLPRNGQQHRFYHISSDLDMLPLERPIHEKARTRSSGSLEVGSLSRQGNLYNDHDKQNASGSPDATAGAHDSVFT